MINDADETSVVVELCDFDRSTGAGATVTERPVWSRVDSAVHRVFENGGFVDLRVIAPASGLVKELTMKSIGGKCRLVALTRSADPKFCSNGGSLKSCPSGGRKSSVMMNGTRGQ